MLCVRARPQFLSPLSLSSPPLRPLLHRFKPFSSSSSPSSYSAASIKMSAQIVEHIVLFKVKPDTDSSKVASMIDGLNALKSLDPVLHLTASPVFRNRSSSFTFTHMLHSLYRTKDDLSVYSAHPSHVSVVAESVRPICEDIMAVDWVVDGLTGPVVPSPGSAMRVTFLKLKEGTGEEEKEEVLGAIGGIRAQLGPMDQLSLGENFSPARAKGFSIASIAMFPGLNELDGLDSNGELANAQKEKARDLLESVIVLDYLIPSPQSASL